MDSALANSEHLVLFLIFDQKSPNFVPFSELLLGTIQSPLVCRRSLSFLKFWQASFSVKFEKKNLPTKICF